ncbi:hypothetical protein Taro_043708 [Colocasia esculenta]|uniref:Uncharacterized protein n=1 Tax=Colocasia esculenta TaxID=4460 RepID=A0A843WLS8_COLES|nr:hypothetical protein [Colocasia esculenta]
MERGNAEKSSDCVFFVECLTLGCSGQRPQRCQAWAYGYVPTGVVFCGSPQLFDFSTWSGAGPFVRGCETERRGGGFVTIFQFRAAPQRCWASASSSVAFVAVQFLSSVVPVYLGIKARGSDLVATLIIPEWTARSLDAHGGSWRQGIDGKFLSGEVISESFSIGSGRSEGLRYAVVLASAFWWVFPELCLGGSGGGPSKDRPLLFLAEVLPRSVLCSFRAIVVLPMWFELLRWPACLIVRFQVLDCASGTLYVPMVQVVCVVSHSQCALTDGDLSQWRWCFLLLRARELLRFSLPMRQSRCSVFCVFFGADVVVVLLMLGPVCSVVLFQACNSLHVAFGGWLLVLVIAPCVVSCALIVTFLRHFMSLLSVRGIETNVKPPNWETACSTAQHISTEARKMSEVKPELGTS